MIATLTVAFFTFVSGGFPAWALPKEADSATAPPLVEEDAPSAPKAKGAQSVIHITADQIRHHKATGETEATGAVELRWKDKIITGDKATYNTVTRSGSMEGSVHYVDSDQDMLAERMEFQANGKTGVLFHAKGVAQGDAYISGARIERVSKDHYIIDNGSYTACKQDKPHWAFHATKTDLTIEDYAYMKQAIFTIGPVPVFYSPWFVAPVKTKRSTGFLRPLVGVSSKYGMEIENAFFWAIADNVDATVTHKHFGTAGDELDGEVRYLFAGGTNGIFKARYLRDTDPDKLEKQDLWKIEADHRMELPFKVINRAHIDMVNVNSFDQQFSDSTLNRTRRYSDSWVEFNRSFDTRSLNLTVRQRKSNESNGAEDTFDTLPTLLFRNQKEQLFGSPFYGAFESSLTGYRFASVRANSPEDTYDVNRFDFAPSLSLPWAVAPWLTIQPQLKFRSTWYSAGLDEQGKRLDESFNREYYTAQMNITGPKFNKIFYTDSKWRPKIKHIIYPNIGWVYIPGLEFDGEDRVKPRIFDGIDGGGRGGTNSITYALVNQIIAREVAGPDKSRVVSLMQLNVRQSYDLRVASNSEIAEKDKKPFGPIVVDLRTRFLDGLMLNYEASYDYYKQFWEKSRLEVGIRYENLLHVALDRSYQWGRGGPDSTWDTGYVEINTPWKIGLEYSIVYDEAKQEVTDSLLRAKYMEDCWMFALNLRNRKVNTFDSAGQSQIEDESIFTFSLTLKNVGDILGKAPKAIAGRKI